MTRAAAEAIGLLAGTLTTLSFTPQLLRIWRRRSAADISYAALVAFIAGVSLWCIYGIAIGSPSVMITNGVTVALNLSILVLKLRSDGRAA
jgi:MtN3 and saliva related transmembrane protein